MAQNTRRSTASVRVKSKIKEALALTHALETQLVPSIEAAHERKALADEMLRIADRLRLHPLDLAGLRGSVAINMPEHTGISAEIARSDGERTFVIRFSPWPPPHNTDLQSARIPKQALRTSTSGG
jgi:hypothetical protein